MTNKLVYVLLTILLYSHNIYANWEVHSINVENGLSQSSVYTVLQDFKGIMWIGTGEGLSRYDGYHIINYSPSDNIKGNYIGGKGVHFIDNINDTEIIVSHEKGIDRFNTKTEVFTHIFNYPFPNVISFRSSQLVIQLYNKGIVTLNIGSGTLKNVCSSLSILLSGNCFVKGNKIFLSDKPGMITIYDIKTQETNRYLLPLNIKGKGAILYFNSYDSDNLILTTTTGSCLFNVNSHTFINLDKVVPLIFLQKNITSYFKDSKKNKWWAIEGVGIYLELADKTLKLISRYEMGYTEYTTLVYKIYEDAEGNIWACTEGNGAWIISNPNKSIVKISESISDNKLVKIGMVFGLLADTSHCKFYVGTFRNGLYELDTNGNISKLAFNTSIGINLNNELIRCIGKLDINTLLIGTEHDIYKYNLTTHIANRVYMPIELSEVMYIQQFRKNVFLIGTNNYTAEITFNLNGSIVSKILQNNKKTFISRFVYLINDSSMIFIRNMEVPLLYTISKKGRNIWKEIDLPLDTKPLYVTFANNRFWWATTNGLIETDKSFNLLKKYLNEDGLANNHIYTINASGKNLWMSTNKGVTCFNIEKKHFINYTLEEGLQSLEFNTNSFASYNKKYFAFGGINGLNIFKVNQNENINNSSNFIITALYVNDTVYSNYVNISHLNNLTLDYNHNTIQLIAQPLSYMKRHPLILFKLQGYDKQWYQTTDGDIRYAHLPAGSYTLKIKLATLYDNHSEGVILCKIYILKPYWQQWWFYVTCIIIIIGSISGIIYFSTTRRLKIQLLKLERQRDLEQMRSRISRDIHDDIGSGLTKIALQSELLKSQLIDNQVKQKAGKIAESSRELISNLNNVIWSMNPRHDNLQGLLAYMREYIYDYMEPTGINVIINFPDELDNIYVNPELRRNLFMILKEALNNIVKYANAKNVELNFTLIMDSFSISIKDDGIGFDLNKVGNFGNGLLNIQKRASLSNAVSSIISQPGIGTSINVRGLL